MADLSRLLDRAIRTGSRIARRLPGTVGGMGIYFSAQHRLADDPDRTDWHADVDALLALADHSLARGRISASLRWYDKALRISYDPALHQAGSSPLAADPAAFLRPLQDSAMGTIMLHGTVPAPSLPERPAPRRRDEGDATTRLLVIAQENWTFIRPIITALRATGRFEVREIEVDELAEAGFPDRDRILRGRYDLVTTGRRMPTPPEIVAGYEWADVVLVEWSHHVLTWVTLLDRAPRALMARLHRFEAFTPFVLLHDHARIDRMLYVSPPVWNLARIVAPGFADVDAVRVGNLLARGLGPDPGSHHDPHLLVQVGWRREVKDVLFSLEVLTRLRARDTSYRLRLIGPGLPASASQDSSFHRRVRDRLAALDPDAVEQLGRREDVPTLLAESGIILSSSHHEGTHESVMEGLAAGCPAVIRDWPDAADYGGPATLYERDWVVADVDAAVQRVLDLAAPERYAAAAREARDFALAHRDPDVLVAAYEHALTPDPAAA
ncbi:glycosyltransferase [Brachybacterium fresconis]|uniref:Glycosyltransferase involved in cell wall biosynthesis n=1 Tax=Brachybacterium fresconis TaxID=173363 RepID=A0ABS4YHG9_9MICO|nr:glycosyltransferase involved in cell wall biosynthesis [Brachybacterium fresconis]